MRWWHFCKNIRANNKHYSCACSKKAKKPVARFSSLTMLDNRCCWRLFFCETMHWTYLLSSVKLNLTSNMWNISCCCKNIVQRFIQSQARRQDPFVLSHCESETFLWSWSSVNLNVALDFHGSHFAFRNHNRFMWTMSVLIQNSDVFTISKWFNERFKIQICSIKMAFNRGTWSFSEYDLFFFLIWFNNECLIGCIWVLFTWLHLVWWHQNLNFKRSNKNTFKTYTN